MCDIDMRRREIEGVVSVIVGCVAITQCASEHQSFPPACLHAQSISIFARPAVGKTNTDESVLIKKDSSPEGLLWRANAEASFITVFGIQEKRSIEH